MREASAPLLDRSRNAKAESTSAVVAGVSSVGVGSVAAADASGA